MKNTRLLLMLAITGVAALMMACGPVNSINPLFTDQEVVFEPTLLGQWSETGKDGTTLRFEQAGPNTYRLTQAEPDNRAQSSYEAHLVGLGQYRFLDVTPEPLSGAAGPQPLSQAPEDAAGPGSPHILRAHRGPAVDPGSARILRAPRGPAAGSQPDLIRVADGFYIELSGGTADNPDRTAHLRRIHWFFKLRTDGQMLRLAALDDEWLQKSIDQGRIEIAHAPLKKGDDVILTAATGDLQRLVLEHVDDDTAFPGWTEFRKVQQ